MTTRLGALVENNPTDGKPPWNRWWNLDQQLRAAIADHLERAGPEPAVRPLHMIEDRGWPVAALSLCERGTHDGVRPAPHGWHFYTDRPDMVTCQDCLEWMHS